MGGAGRRAGRCPGSAGSPDPPPAGPAATPSTPSSPSAPDGEIIEAGTTRRFFTQAQRRAIIARDGDRCAVPYCDRPISWADAHHLIPVGKHGPTTVANGAIPCDGHHTLLHEGHWQLHRLPDGRYLIHHPHTGRTIGPEEHPPGHNRPTPRPPPDPDDPDPD